MLEIRRGKALATIVEAATVTDSNGEVVELSRIQPDGSLGDPAAAADEGLQSGESTDVVNEPVDSTEDSATDSTEASAAEETEDSAAEKTDAKA